MSNSERFMICHNPDGATRDAHLREQLVAQLVELITGPDTLPAMKRGELRGKISTKPGRNPYLRVSPGGLVRIDKAKIKAEANRDGKYLLRCSDPHLPAADIARLEAAPRGRTRLRDMKQILDLRPVYHRLEQRIRAHVVLCWLALLLIRIIETTTGQTWHHICRDLDRLRHHLHRPHRNLPPAHRPHQGADRPLRPARPPLPKKIIEITPDMRRMRVTAAVLPWHTRSAAAWLSVSR